MSDFAGTERSRHEWRDMRTTRSRRASTDASRIAHGGSEATGLVAQWSVDPDGRLRCAWAEPPVRHYPDTVGHGDAAPVRSTPNR
jgi:hypothetical protein